jgi:two-component system, OmpR family, sensor histidine kinase BaeS
MTDRHRRPRTQRLGLQLAIAMLAVAVLSVSAVVAAQWVLAKRVGAELPSAVATRLQELRQLEATDDGDGLRAVFGPWVRVLVRPPPPSIVVDGEGAVVFRDPRVPQAPVDPDAGPAAGAVGVTLGDWPTVVEAVRGLGRVQDAQWAGLAMGLGLAALLATATAMWLARTIARPVQAVGVAAAQLSEGDLGARVALSRNRLGGSAELEQLADAFNAMADALQRAERQRTNMVADIAHELRTPLTAMSLRLDALRDGLVSIGPAEVERLRRQAALLGRLVEDLRTLSLADAGRLRLERTQTEVFTLAEAVVEGQVPTAAASGVRLEVVRVGTAPIPLVAGDRDRLAQVLGNLLDNAIRVTPPGRRVRVEVGSEAGDAVWRVRDEGPGIAAAELPRIFERFRQGEGERRDTRGGSGLGLAIVRTLVELHGGAVEVESPPGQGATFTVRFPSVPA